MQVQTTPSRSAAATVVAVLAIASLAGLVAVPGVVADHDADGEPPSHSMSVTTGPLLVEDLNTVGGSGLSFSIDVTNDRFALPIAVVEIVSPSESLKFEKGTATDGWSGTVDDDDEKILRFTADAGTAPLLIGQSVTFNLGADVSVDDTDFTVEVIGKPAAGVPSEELPVLPPTDSFTLKVETPPTIIESVKTVNDDRDGDLDAYHVTFNKALDPFSLLEGQWKIANIESGGVGLGSDQSILIIDFPFSLEGDYDTGETPALTYDATSPAKGSRGTPIDASGINVEDGAPPVRLSAETSGTSAGVLDSILITFSEPLTEGAALDEDFTLSMGSVTDAAIQGADVDQILLTLDQTASLALDTGATPLITYEGDVGDGSNMLTDLGTEGSIQWITTDKAAPVAFSVETRDSDSTPDGRLDQIVIAFSEDMEGANHLEYADFTVQDDLTDTDYEVLPNAGVEGNEITLSVVRDGRGHDTDAIPTVSYMPDSANDSDDFPLSDAWGNSWAHTGDLATPADRARPVIVSAVTQDDGDGVLDAYLVTFSEPIASSVAKDGWSVGGIDADGIHDATPGDDEILVLLDAVALDGASIPIGTGDTPQLTYDAPTTNSVKDLADRPLANVEADDVTEEDGAKLRVVSAVTVDDDELSNGVDLEDGDGVLDAYLVTFSEPIASSVTKNGWSVGGKPAYGINDATPEDDEILVLLDAVALNAASIPIGTGDTPQLTYSGGDVEDLADKSLDTLTDDTGSNDVTEEDRAAPVAVSAVTVDDDGGVSDGVLDAYLVTFSEPIAPGATEAGWEVGGVAATGIDATGLASNQLLVLFDVDTMVGAGISVGTGDTPQLTYDSSSGDVRDLAVEPLASIANGDIDEVDDASVVLVAVETVDGLDGGDPDGVLDAVRVVFSEALDEDTIDDAHWLIDNTDDFTLDTGDAGQGVLLFELGSSFDLDTGETPAVVYTEGTLAAGDGTPVDGFSVDATDKADPVLLRAFIHIGDTKLTAVFSEGVYGGTSDQLITDEGAFNYVNQGSTVDQALQDVSHTAGSRMVELTVDNAFEETDEGEGDTLGVVTDKVYDAAENLAVTTAIVVDGEAFVIETATTMDLVDGDGEVGADGRIDTIEIVFSIPLDDTIDDGANPILEAADWTVDGYTVSSVAITANDELTISLVQGAAPDTGEVPTFSYTADSAKGSNPEPIVDEDRVISLEDLVGEGTEDGADMIRFAIETVDGLDGGEPDGVLDAVRVVFSEALDENTINEEHWVIDKTNDFTFDEGDADQGVLLFELGSSFDLDTGATPEVDYEVPDTDTRLAADNDATDEVADFSMAADDTALPLILSVTGNPGDQSVLLTLSEPVVGSGDDGGLLVADLEYASNGAGASGIADLAVLDDKTAKITLDPPLAFDDVDPDGTPDVLRFAPGNVNDEGGNPALVADVNLTDAIPPGVESATTADSDGDGRIDRVVLAFTEELDDADFDATDFGVVDHLVNETESSLSGDTVTLVLDVDPAEDPIDTGARPVVTYAAVADALTDLVGNDLAGFDDLVPDDGAAPVAVSATSVDDGDLSNGIDRVSGNGVLDGYLVEFSEDVSAIDDPGGWTIASGDAHVVPVNHASVGGDQLLVVFDVPSDLGTDELPVIKYDASVGTVADKSAAANAAPSFDGAHLTGADLVDGAAPVLLDVQGQLGSSQVTVVFSEPVHNGGGQGLTDDALDYVDTIGGNAADILSIAHTAPSDTAVLTLADDAGDEAELNAADMDDDMVVPAGGFVRDAAGNPAPADVTHQVAFVDATAPEVEAVRTDDSDGDGRIDRIVIGFSEALDETTETTNAFNADDFKVGDGAYVIDASHSQTGISGRTVVLALDVDDSEPCHKDGSCDTDAEPAVTFASDATTVIQDAASADPEVDNVWDGSLPGTDDAALPVIVWARGTDGSPFVDIRFSEPVFGDEEANLLDDASVFDYEDLSGPVELKDDIQQSDDRTLVHLVADGDIDFGTDKVAVLAADTVFDQNGLASPAMDRETIMDYAIVADLDEPVFDEAITVDDGAGLGSNGILDAIELTFSKAVFSNEGSLGTDAWKVGTLGAEGCTEDYTVGGASFDGAVVTLTLVEGSVDTAAMPDICYERPQHGALVDVDGVPVASFTDNAGDGAAPALVRAVGSPGSDRVTLHFSEMLDSDLLITDLDYDDDNGVGGSGVDEVTEPVTNAANDDLTAEVRLIGTLQSEDIGAVPGEDADAVGVVAGLSDGTNVADGHQVLVVDDRAPTIESVATVDGDGDGLIDALQVTLSEAFEEEDGTFTADGFSITSDPFAETTLEALTAGSADNGVEYAAAGTNAFYLAFDEAGDPDVGDTDLLPALDYDDNVGSIEDLSGNVLSGDVPAAMGDGAAPAILSAETRDDGDGVIDAYLVRFSEPVDVDSADGWSVGDVPATAAATAAVDEILVTFGTPADPEDEFPTGTGDAPQLTYSAPEAGGVSDASASSNDLADAANGDVAESDGAPPVILEINAQPGDTEAHVLFSEDVHNGAGDSLTASRFTFDGSPFTGTVVHAAATAEATLVFDDPIEVADLGKNDVSVMNVFDAAKNKADHTRTVSMEDLTAPSIKTTTTDDSDGDGRIDRILIVFDEDLDPTNFEPEDFGFTSDDYAIDVDHADNGVAGDTVTLVLDVPAGQPFDTDATPTVTYDVDSDADPLTDLAGNDWDDQPGGTLDGAAPILVSAQVVDSSSTTVRLRFSEPVFAAGDAQIDVDQFEYDRGDDDAGDDKAINDVEHVLDARTVDLIMDASLGAGDLASGADPDKHDKVTVVDDDADGDLDVFDGSGNPLAAGTASADIVGGPFVKSITTLDDDGNGLLDALEVEFSEAIEDGGNLDAADWSVAGAAIDDVTTGDAPDDDTILIALAEDQFDTGDTPIVGYSGTGIEGRDSGLPLLEFFDHASVDGAAPVILPLGVATVDEASGDPAVGDGVLDFLEVTFSEPVDGSDFDAADWTIAWDGGSDEPTDGSSAGRVLQLAMPVDLGTGATPELSYDGSGFGDPAGNALLEVTDHVSVDGAAPVLLSATVASDDLTKATLTFSEPVRGSGDSNEVTADDLDYGDEASNGAGGIVDVAHTVDTATVTVTLDADLADDDADQDTIAPAADRIMDGENAAAAVAVSLTTDTTPPAAIGVLGVGTVTASSVKLTFTAVADDGDDAETGRVESYQVRYHTSTITQATWDDAGVGKFIGSPSVDPGEPETITVTGLDMATTYNFYVRAVDDAGRLGAIHDDPAEATTLEDGTPPAGTLTISSQTHESGTVSPETKAILSWNELSDPESTVTYRHAVNDEASYTVKDDDDPASGSITLDDLDDGVHYVHLAAFSAGGDKQASPFHLVIDSTPPGGIDDLEAGEVGPLSITLAWTAPGDDDGDGTAEDYRLYRSDDDFGASDLGDVALVSGVVAPEAAGTAQTFEVTGLVPDTAYHFAILARDDAGNAGALSDVVEVSTDPDSTPPTGDLGLQSSTHSDGVESLVNDATFLWDAASDSETDVQYRYAVNDDENHTLQDTDSTTSATQITLQDLDAGTHHFHVAAQSAGGLGAQESFVLVITQLSDTQIEEANQGITTTVKRDGDTNVVQWTLPDDLPADVHGVQVLRSNSPYAVVATLDADSDGFEDGTFVDDSQEALKSSKYLVTMYFEADVGKYDSTGDIQVSEQLQGAGIVQDSAAGGLVGSVAFYVGLLGLLASVALLVVAVVMRPRRAGEEVQE